jgi:hypothetical protein
MVAPEATAPNRDKVCARLQVTVLAVSKRGCFGRRTSSTTALQGLTIVNHFAILNLLFSSEGLLRARKIKGSKVAHTSFCMPRPLKRFEASQCFDLLEHWRLQPSYGAPVLLVPQPDGLIADVSGLFSALNYITIRRKHPEPRVKDLLDNLSGAQYFSSLDLTSGSHQLSIAIVTAR